MTEGNYESITNQIRQYIDWASDIKEIKVI